MRALILVTFLCLVSVSLAGEEYYLKLMGECAKELGVKVEANGKPDEEESEKKCLAKCMGTKMGIIDESGQIKEDNIPSEMKNLVKECSPEIKETDVCKMANEMQKCIMAKIK